jgi:hypothetical protein
MIHEYCLVGYISGTQVKTLRFALDGWLIAI